MQLTSFADAALVLASACRDRKNSGRDMPKPASVPICKKLRRDKPSQVRAEPKSKSSMSNSGGGRKGRRLEGGAGTDDNRWPLRGLQSIGGMSRVHSIKTNRRINRFRSVSGIGWLRAGAVGLV